MKIELTKDQALIVWSELSLKRKLVLATEYEDKDLIQTKREYADALAKIMNKFEK